MEGAAGDESRGSGMRGLLLWSGQGTPLVNCWLTSGQGDDMALVFSKTTSEPTSPTFHKNTSKEASEEAQQQSLMQALAASSHLGGVGASQQPSMVKMKLSMAKLGALLTALKHFQDRSGASGGGILPVHAADASGSKPVAIPATLQLNVPIAVQHKTPRRKREEEKDKEDGAATQEGEASPPAVAEAPTGEAPAKYFHVPLNAAVVFGDRCMLCALDVFDPSKGQSSNLTSPSGEFGSGDHHPGEEPQSVMKRGNNRICDGRNLVTMLAFNALMHVPDSQQISSRRGSQVEFGTTPLGAQSSGPGTRGHLNVLLDKLLEEQVGIDKQERKEENFNTKEILADDASMEATAEFTVVPRTVPKLREVGVHSFLSTVQSFVTELLREQKGSPGLYFLQGCNSVPRSKPIVAQNSTADDKKAKEKKKQQGGERQVAPWDEQGDPHQAGVNASGWFATEGIQRKHSAFVVAGTHESPQGKSCVEAAILEACMLVIQREVVNKARKARQQQQQQQQQNKSDPPAPGTLASSSNNGASLNGASGVYVTELLDANDETHYVTWAARLKPVAPESDAHTASGAWKAQEMKGDEVEHDCMYIFVDLNIDIFAGSGDGADQDATSASASDMLPFFEVKTRKMPEGSGGSMTGLNISNSNSSAPNGDAENDVLYPPAVTGSGLVIASLAAMLDSL